MSTKITSKVALEIVAAGGTPWQTSQQGTVYGIYRTRDAARAAAKDSTLKLKVEKYVPGAEEKVIEEKPAKKVAVPRNGACKRVWQIADEMPQAKRRDVIAACVEAGIAFGTARTQYQSWFKQQNS